ncbi:MAG: hypothetical protein ACTSU4_01770 [Promethearchaeota archaeon]
MVDTENQDDIKIFVAVCECGINIAEIIDCEKLAEYTKNLPNVVGAKNYLSLCTEAGAEFIRENVEESKANRVIVAA